MLMVIYLFALLIFIAGLILLAIPTLILDFMDKYSNNLSLYIGAIMGIGILSLYMADLSRFPLTMTIIGWVAIAAAVFFVGIGKSRFVKMIKWVMKPLRPWARVFSIRVILFSGFFLYAFV